MMKSKAIYLRVSKEDLDESTQLPVILNKFQLKEEEVNIYRERVSAYKEASQEKRTEFIKLKEQIEANMYTDVYVYSIERFERNIERMFEFFFFCQANNTQLHSAEQEIQPKRADELPIHKMMRYFQLLMFGYVAEEESYKTSQRTKKSFVEINGNTFSYKGNKVGKPFTDLDGNRIDLDEGSLYSLQEEILYLIRKHEKNKEKNYYKQIIDKIRKEYNLNISKAYLTKMKNVGLNK